MIEYMKDHPIAISITIAFIALIYTILRDVLMSRKQQLHKEETASLVGNIRNEFDDKMRKIQNDFSDLKGRVDVIKNNVGDIRENIKKESELTLIEKQELHKSLVPIVEALNTKMQRMFSDLVGPAGEKGGYAADGVVFSKVDWSYLFKKDILIRISELKENGAPLQLTNRLELKWKEIIGKSEERMRNLPNLIPIIDDPDIVSFFENLIEEFGEIFRANSFNWSKIEAGQY